MGKQEQFGMRIESDFKARLQAALDESSAEGHGSSLSHLFRILGMLFLGDAVEASEEDLSAQAFEIIESRMAAMEKKLWETGDLSAREWNLVRDLLGSVQGGLHGLMTLPNSITRHRGLLLVGRLQIMWYEYATRELPPR